MCCHLHAWASVPMQLCGAASTALLVARSILMSSGSCIVLACMGLPNSRVVIGPCLRPGFVARRVYSEYSTAGESQAADGGVAAVSNLQLLVDGPYSNGAVQGLGRALLCPCFSCRFCLKLCSFRRFLTAVVGMSEARGAVPCHVPSTMASSK